MTISPGSARVRRCRHSCGSPHQMTALPPNTIEAMGAPDWWGPWFCPRRLDAVAGVPQGGVRTADDADWSRHLPRMHGRDGPPGGRVSEAYADVGRRGGK